MRRTVALSLGLLVLGGCGGEAQEPAVPRVVSEATTSIRTPPAAPVRRAPPELRRYWPLGKMPEFALYGDLAGLLHSEAVAHVLPKTLAGVKDSVSPEQRRCIDSVLGNVRSVAVGFGKPGEIALFELGPSGMKAARAACTTVMSLERTSVAGGSEAYADGSNVLVFEPSIVLLGRKTLVESALTGSSSAWPDGLALEGDQLLKVRGNFGNGVLAGGSFSLGAQRLNVTIDVDLPSEDLARTLEAKYRDVGGSTADELAALQSNPDLPGGVSDLIQKLVTATRVSRHERRITVALELPGTTEEQAATLGLAAAAGMYGVREYMVRAKSAEARVTAVQIAKAYAAHFEANRRGKAKLFELPPVPALVPRGQKYQSHSEDWKSWQAIGFSLEAPQYYQYQVMVEPNGKTGAVVARGDLDGDGTTSIFRLRLSLNPRTHTVSIAPNLQSVSPGE